MTRKQIGLVIVLISTLLYFAEANAYQQRLNPQDVLGTFTAGHRYGRSSITLEDQGNYRIESSDCTTSTLESGHYEFSSGVLHFTVLERALKSNMGEPDADLLDPEAVKRVYGPESSNRITKSFELIPVKWSGRLYLLSEGELEDFCNAVNLSVEPRLELVGINYSYVIPYRFYGSFYLRDGDEKKKVSGKPLLPEKWGEFILKEPVDAVVLSIEQNGEETLARIDKGSRDGLKVGMELINQGEEMTGAKVIAVGEKSARVQIYRLLKVGDKLNSKFNVPDIN